MSITETIAYLVALICVAAAVIESHRRSLAEIDLRNEQVENTRLRAELLAALRRGDRRLP